MSETKKPPSRQYPPLWEKMIPYLLGFILLAMLILLVVAVGVAMGWFG